MDELTQYNENSDIYKINNEGESTEEGCDRKRVENDRESKEKKEEEAFEPIETRANERKTKHNEPSCAICTVCIDCDVSGSCTSYRGCTQQAGLVELLRGLKQVSEQ
ncbi:predicted protein [Histoplasma mississippiense (nom. inval.)]|uniref:predicted protein n=1 Tax=Ajellomyces capsulatus (strain NAm1 / WU24) TaxID=2059318 RepID=UPI000157CB7F|nr:predicted protein [Histoplasma mississippiense (nom. inval.)]EDN10245.1 predicted protein [Histoplasma mississippiense (nom. inval.)]